MDFTIIATLVMLKLLTQFRPLFCKTKIALKIVVPKKSKVTMPSTKSDRDQQLDRVMSQYGYDEQRSPYNIDSIDYQFEQPQGAKLNTKGKFPLGKQNILKRQSQTLQQDTNQKATPMKWQQESESQNLVSEHQQQDRNSKRIEGSQLRKLQKTKAAPENDATHTFMKSNPLSAKEPFQQVLDQLRKSTHPKPSESLISTISACCNLLKTRNPYQVYDTYIKLANHCVAVDIMDHVSNEMIGVSKLTPEIQADLNDTLLGLVRVYSQRYKKRYSNLEEDDIQLMMDKDGLIQFLVRFKYLAYHLECNAVKQLSQLLLLYSAAQDLLRKKQNFLEIEKAGVATVLFKIITTTQQMDPFTFSQIIFVISRFTLSNVSGYLRASMYKFLDTQQPKHWHKCIRSSKSIIYSFGKTGIVNQTFQYNIHKLSESYEQGQIDDVNIASRIVMCMLNLRLTTVKEMQKNYPILYSDAIDNLGNSEKHLLDIIRNGIWDAKYWHRTLSKIKASSFLDSNLRALIPTAVYFVNLIQNEIDIESKSAIMAEIDRLFEIPIFRAIYFKMDEHHKEYFGVEIQSSVNSFQREVWRTLKRLGYCVQMERVVAGLRVDLFFPRRNLVIQLNGQDHYIKNIRDGKISDQQNRISVFKQKILQKSGTLLLTIKLTNSSNPNTTALHIMNYLEEHAPNIH